MLSSAFGHAGRRIALLGVFTGIVLAVNATVLHGWIELARTDQTASHLILVPVVAAILLFQRRRTVFAEPTIDLVSGAALALPGLVLAWYSRLSDTPGGSGALSAAIAGVVLLWIGGFAALYGRRAARAALFPLAFLACAIPIPPSAIRLATQLLKTGSADGVAALFTMTGTPFHQEGFVFALPRFAIEIADECSGIRSSIALVLTTMLVGDAFLDKPWKRIVLVTIAPVLAIVKNAVRITALSLLAMHVDPSFLTGQLHHEGGFVFFAIALTMVAPVVGVLRRIR